MCVFIDLSFCRDNAERPAFFVVEKIWQTATTMYIINLIYTHIVMYILKAAENAAKIRLCINPALLRTIVIIYIIIKKIKHS